MKVKIEMTVDIDTKALNSYLKDMGIEDETPTEFAKSHMIASAWQVLDSSLSEHASAIGISYDYIKVLKQNQ